MAEQTPSQQIDARIFNLADRLRIGETACHALVDQAVPPNLVQKKR